MYDRGDAHTNNTPTPSHTQHPTAKRPNAPRAEARRGHGGHQPLPREPAPAVAGRARVALVGLGGVRPVVVDGLCK